MSFRSGRVHSIWGLLCMALFINSCTQNTAPGTRTIMPGAASGALSPATQPVAANVAAAVTAASPRSTPRAVIITAVKGNVYIRRGPDLAFDPVGALMDGQNAKAVARDVLAKWAQIEIPGKAGRTGWISLQTRFVRVTANILDLPEVMPTEWPIGASLRNCTRHDMQVDPGGIFIPPFELFPDNEVRINPGIYTIYDTTLDNRPQVMKVEIREGSYIDIRSDGEGNRHKCPAP